VSIVLIPTALQIIKTNEYICKQGGNPYSCIDPGKVESVLHTAFYPGAYPFQLGGIAKLAKAICFYLVKGHAFMDGNKRTGALTAITFLNVNGWDLQYPVDDLTQGNAFADIIEGCAASSVTKEQLMEWFDSHKVRN
jgi:death-on-curing protein